MEQPQVDYRFILANERTFLAWMRTALGLVAGGVALDQFVALDDRSWAIGVIATTTVFLCVVAIISLRSVVFPVPALPVRKIDLLV